MTWFHRPHDHPPGPTSTVHVGSSADCAKCGRTSINAFDRPGDPPFAVDPHDLSNLDRSLPPMPLATFTVSPGRIPDGIAAAFRDAAIQINQASTWKAANPGLTAPPGRHHLLARAWAAVRWGQLRAGRVAVYIEPTDLWVGVFIGPNIVYVCPLPCVVIAIQRRAE